MSKSLKSVFLFIALTCLTIVAATRPAQLQDQDPRDYYPEGCDPAQEDRIWRTAPGAEDFTLTRLNQWRLAVGASPLQRNRRLDILAERQAKYIAPDAPFSDPKYQQEGVFSAWHDDVIGAGVLRRLELNGWPAYDNGLRIGGEIAAYWPSVSASISFWQDSSIHNYTASLDGFREVGIRVLCWRGWLLSYVVFAARPDTLTVTYDPYTGLLYLGDESRSYTGANPGFRPDYVQITDVAGNRLHTDEWLLWSEFIPLPEDAPADILVMATDGVTTITTTVNIITQRTFPSQPTPTPSPTFTPMPPRPPRPTPLPPTPPPTATPRPKHGGQFDVMIYYNEDYFSVVNESGRELNLERLLIRAAEFPELEMSVAFFGQYYASNGGDLSAFPPGACLQGFSLERFNNGPGPRPDSCEKLVSWRNALRPSERFWLRERFQILYNLEVIASCEGLVIRTEDLMCGFDLP